MGVPEYSPNDNEHIVHRTTVDFVQRYREYEAVHIVQYDNSLPIIEVTLLKNGKPYRVPDNAEISIKLCKKDGKFVYNPALGRKNTESGNIVFFEITYQMTTIYGRIKPIVEVKMGSSVAASGAFDMWIDRNPVQEGAEESANEYKSIDEKLDEIKYLIEQIPKCDCKIASDEEINEMIKEVFG